MDTKKVKEMQKGAKKMAEDLQDMVLKDIGEVRFDRLNSLSEKDRKIFNAYKEASRQASLAATQLGKLLEK